MPTATVEDYLKTILLAEEGHEPGGLVTMGQIATSLAVAPGTVTSMVKTLEKGGLLAYEPYSGVRLTTEGRHVATHVVRRHRLIELFLVEILGLDWSEVHEEAERLEHAMSDKLVDRVDDLLGHPRFDPHGDPIPDLEGRVREKELVRLVDARPGEVVQVARVSDQDEEFLRFVERQGLKPGTRVAVQARDKMADAVTVRPDAREDITIGGEAAAKLWVEPIRGD